MINQFQTTALMGVESLINKALTFDPAALEAISRLQDKVLKIECSVPPLEFYVLHSDSGLHLASYFEGDVDVTLTGTAVALAGLAINSGQLSNLADTGVRLTGDQSVLVEIQAIMKNLDVDWETALAQLIGDVPAYIIGNSIRSAGEWGKSARHRAPDVASGFAREEARITPSRTELSGFTEQVQKLRSDTDRLSARVQQLASRMMDNKAG